jgi:hypothetical protein
MDAGGGYQPSFWHKAGRFLAKEFMHALPAVVFFAVGFNLILFSMNLVLAAYFIHFASFMLATGAALIVGKVVLVADKMPFLRRFDTAPLIRPIIFKSVVYTALVFVARVIEDFIKYWIDEGHAVGFGAFAVHHFSWYRFSFVQLWIFVLFLIYTTGAELNALFGQGELYKLMFVRRSSATRLTRRQRVRTLVQISRLTQRYSLEALQDVHSPAHNALVGHILLLVEDKPIS